MCSPAAFLYIDATGVAAKFHEWAFKVARRGIRKLANLPDVGDVERNPAAWGPGEMEVWPSLWSVQGSGGDLPQQFEGEGGEEISVSSSLGPSVRVGESSRASSYSLFAQLVPSTCLSARLPPPGSSFDANCTQRNAPD